MRTLSRLGLRARLAIALGGLAAAAVVLATLLSAGGVDTRLNEAGMARLQRSAQHVAGMAKLRYRQRTGWTSSSIETLERLAKVVRLRVVLRDAGGKPVSPVQPLAPGAPTAAAPVVVRGRVVGRAVVSPLDGKLLAPEDARLRTSLGRLHLIAGIVSVAAGLLVALLLAHMISAPRRRIRAGAERLQHGELSARVEPTGDPEVRTVAGALNRLAETLEQQEQLRGQTVADLAHELRTPVNALLSRIEAAEDRVLTDDQANLAAMHAEALRLARLLDDLAQLAEAERPGLLLEKQRLDLADVARAEARDFEPRFTEKGVAFATELQPVVVDGDATRLGQIVDNLLANALRYTERGGNVRLRVARADGSAVLEVSDTGIGIAQEDLDHVFKRFWRGDKSRSRATGGAGIGLAIVEQLVRAHEGRIEVESEPGRGSTFRVLLRPATRATPHDRVRLPGPSLRAAGRGAQMKGNASPRTR